jgi:prefoldin subunit 5
VEKMKNLMKERNDLKEELESIDKQMELLKTRKEIATKTLENLKLRFKKECLRDSGGHDTHYWLRMSIETPIGKFSQEQ